MFEGAAQLNTGFEPTLKVASGSKVSTFNLPAGSSDVQASFAVGSTPVFEVDRNG